MKAILFVSMCLTAAPSGDKAGVLVVVGAEGTAEYGALFRAWSENWRAAAVSRDQYSGSRFPLRLT